MAGDVEDNLTYQGNMARIAVGTIKAKSENCSDEMAASVGEMLSTALSNTGRFIVLASQEEVGELAEELDFAESEYAESEQGPEKGLMESADIIITGAVTAFEPDAGGAGGGLGGLVKKAAGDVGVGTRKAKLEMDLKLIDVRTRRIIKAKSVKAESTNWSLDMSGAGWSDDIAMDGALGVYANEPMEKAIRAVLVKAVDMISAEVPKEYYRYQGKGQYNKEYRESGAAPAGSGTSPTAATASAEPAKAPAAEDMTLYTKYDFVPGDRVIFFDDLTGEEEGEFPLRWNLDEGVYEIARMGGKLWILCTDEGSVRPKTPTGPLPEKYTVEYEFYDPGPEKSAPYHFIQWVGEDDGTLAEFEYYGGRYTYLYVDGKEVASKLLAEPLSAGSHTMRIMATSRSIKCYLDQERVANVPKVDGFNPIGFRIWHDPYDDSPCLFKTFRFAEGGKSLREQLDESGRIVTHGILFDSGSDKIKAESFKTLKDIGELLQEDAGLRLSVEGHTDSDGADDFNLTLSQNRARSVCDYLVATYAVDRGRLEAKGWGEGKPIDTNSSSEGKANNRRVELVKL